MSVSDEVKLVLFIKIPMFVLGAAIGLGIVWVALMFIPGAAHHAIESLAP